METSGEISTHGCSRIEGPSSRRTNVIAIFQQSTNHHRQDVEKSSAPRMRIPQIILFLMTGWLLAVGQDSPLDRLRVEYEKRFASASRDGKVEDWGVLAGWVEHQLEIAPPDSPLRPSLNEWLARVQMEIVEAELKSLDPEDRRGLLALSEKYSKGGLADLKVREALIGWLRRHPQDDEIYRRCLAGIPATARFAAHFAKSDGLLAMAEQEKKAEFFFQIGQWHETLPSNECNQAVARAIWCYLKSIRLKPDEPKYRQTLDQYLDKIIPGTINPGDISKALPPEQAHIPHPDQPRTLQWTEPSKEEEKLRIGRRFKVEHDGTVTYEYDAPTHQDNVIHVWELLPIPHPTGAAHGQETKTEPTEEESSTHASPEGWVMLRWDEETREWVTYTKAEDRQRLRHDLDRVQEDLESFKKSIPILESTLRKCVQPENPGDRLLREASNTPTLQEVNAFLLRLLNEREEQKCMLATLQVQRVCIPALEKEKEEIGRKLATVEKRGKQRHVSIVTKAMRHWKGILCLLTVVAVIILRRMIMGFCKKTLKGLWEKPLKPFCRKVLSLIPEKILARFGVKIPPAEAPPAPTEEKTSSKVISPPAKLTIGAKGKTASSPPGSPEKTDAKAPAARPPPASDGKAPSPASPQKPAPKETVPTQPPTPAQKPSAPKG
jgi:hypothetical protein